MAAADPCGWASPMWPPAVRPASAGQPAGAVEWEQVRAIRELVAERIADGERAGGAPRTEGDRRELGRTLIQDEVARYVDRLAEAGREPPGAAEEDALRHAVFAAVFGLGRLQPLVDDPGVENIEIYGHDNVWLVYADGTFVQGPPVADSDGELVAEVQQLAARHGRQLSTANPTLHMRLPDGSRLLAMIETCSRPMIAIRRHRVLHVSLQDLVERGTVSQALAEFLTAAVRARRNIVITGEPNAGKTTLMRALAGAIPSMERYATVEKEYELHLDSLGGHPRMTAFEAREGSSEHTAGGRPAGQVSLRQLVEDVLRGNFSRIIVGEVRGDEVLPMLESVSSGGRGSMCTIHANSARDAFERIVTLCLSRAGLDSTFAYRLAAQAIDLIVNVRLLDESFYGGGRHRYVDEVLEVHGIGESDRPAMSELFTPGTDGRAVPVRPPTYLAELERVGLRREWFTPGGHGDWDGAGDGLGVESWRS